MDGTPTTWSSKFLRAWKRLQVSCYGGKYSIQRMLALENYTKNTPLLRVFCVGIATPLPMIALVYVQELVPLQSPREAWHTNYGFWIRLVILMFVVTHSTTGQLISFVNGVTISTRRLILQSASVSTIFTASMVTVSAYVVFPVPFSILVATPMYNVILLSSFRVIIGNHILRQLLAERAQVIRYLNFMYAQLLMMYVYPVYEMLFRVAEGSQYQLPVI